MELNEWVKQNEKVLRRIIVLSMWKRRKAGWKNKIDTEDLKQSLWLKIFQAYSKHKKTNLGYYTTVCLHEITDYCSRVWGDDELVNRNMRIEDDSNMFLTDSNFAIRCYEQNKEDINCNVLTILDFLKKNKNKKENRIIYALLRRYEGFEQKLPHPDNTYIPSVSKEQDFARAIAIESGYKSNNNNYYNTKFKALFKLKKFMMEETII